MITPFWSDHVERQDLGRRQDERMAPSRHKLLSAHPFLSANLQTLAQNGAMVGREWFVVS